MSQSHGPLHGVKVVTCSTAQAGTVPYMLMADLGAEVIKIEVPDGGDPSRGSTVLPGHPSTYFETNNRGVKSVTLNLKTREGREILHKLVATAEMFGQNFRPGAAEKNGFGYDELRKINPALVYISISGYGPNGPHADLPGTDAMAQALGGIAEAYSTPGQPMRTGIVSVADETCAILAFGGALAALTYARSTGIGQKVDCSLLGGQIRLMGWTLTTTMWRDRNPVTGQARIVGTPDRPGMSASFNDGNGKPLVFQLNGARQWRDGMTALGFYERLEVAGQRPRRFGQRLRDGSGLPPARQEAQGAWLAVAILRNAGPDRRRAGSRHPQRRGAGPSRLQRTADRRLPGAQGHLRRRDEDERGGGIAAGDGVGRSSHSRAHSRSLCQMGAADRPRAQADDGRLCGSRAPASH